MFAKNVSARNPTGIDTGGSATGVAEYTRFVSRTTRIWITPETCCTLNASLVAVTRCMREARGQILISSITWGKSTLNGGLAQVPMTIRMTDRMPTA